METKPIHILIVEDDLGVIRGIRRELRRREDIVLHFVDNSRDARALYQEYEGDFAIIALDYDLAPSSPEKTSLPFLKDVLRPVDGSDYRGRLVTISGEWAKRKEMLKLGCDEEITLKSLLVGYILGFVQGRRSIPTQP